MKCLISVSLAVIMTFCLIVATDRRAWGYVDPGSGLIALQTIASVGAAYAYYIRRRIRTFFSRREQEPATDLSVASVAAKSREIA